MIASESEPDVDARWSSVFVIIHLHLVTTVIVAQQAVLESDSSVDNNNATDIEMNDQSNAQQQSQSQQYTWQLQPSQ